MMLKPNRAQIRLDFFNPHRWRRNTVWRNTVWRNELAKKKKRLFFLQTTGYTYSNFRHHEPLTVSQTRQKGVALQRSNWKEGWIRSTWEPQGTSLVGVKQINSHHNPTKLFQQSYFHRRLSVLISSVFRL